MSIFKKLVRSLHRQDSELKRSVDPLPEEDIAKMPPYNECIRNARRNAKPECEKCGGKGEYEYDDNHWKICEKCCQHNLGWFKGGQFHGEANGKWICKAGCGLAIDEFERTILEWKKIDEQEKESMK